MTDRRTCNGKTQAHHDALRLVEYLLKHNGEVEKPNETIAFDLAMFKTYRAGRYETDLGRFSRAVNHIKDNDAPDGKPCTGYMVHYRRSGRISTLALIDPETGRDSGAHRAIAAFLGWMSREAQHQTTNRRMISEAERLGDDALARHDRSGHHLCTRIAVEIDRYGTVTPETRSEFMAWATSQ